MREPEIFVARPEGLPGVELQGGTGATGYVRRGLCAITGGHGELCYRGTTYRSSAGALNLVEPGEVHSFQPGNPRGCDYLDLDFDPALFRMATVDHKPAFSSPTTYDPDTFRRFMLLHRSIIEQQTAFLGLLVTLLRRHTRTRVSLKPAGHEPGAVGAVREYLAENYAKRIDLAQLAVLTGLSPFHLTRVFARATGLPPHAFLAQTRISRAKALLRRSVPISRVALETGFADQSHLTRAFKEMGQVSPGIYRRSAVLGGT
jgi:AraC-like DNA-binding protein